MGFRVSRYEPRGRIITFSPKDIPGLVAWWCADDVILSGSNSVVRVNDKSGTGFFLTQSIPANIPTLDINSVVSSSRPSIYFSGTFLTSTINWNQILPDTKSFTVFAVYKGNGNSLVGFGNSWKQQACVIATNNGQFLLSQYYQTNLLTPRGGESLSWAAMAMDDGGAAAGWGNFGNDWIVTEVNYDITRIFFEATSCMLDLSIWGGYEGTPGGPQEGTFSRAPYNEAHMGVANQYNRVAFNGASLIRVGVSPDTLYGNFYFIGNIAEILMYSGSLSKTQSDYIRSYFYKQYHFPFLTQSIPTY